jgi:competence protein ComGF
MQLFQKNIPAFTLIEIIISMLIMSFLAIASYMLLQKSGILVAQEQQRVQASLESTQFYTTLLYDISHSNSVQTTQSNRITIRNQISPDIEYIFYTDMLIRSHAHARDTFTIRMYSISPEIDERSLRFTIEHEHEKLEVYIALPYTLEHYCNQTYLLP